MSEFDYQKLVETIAKYHGRGKCRVCGGDIVEAFSSGEKPDAIPKIVFGEDPECISYLKSGGLHCESCGLVYKFIPKSKSESRKKKFVIRVELSGLRVVNPSPFQFILVRGTVAQEAPDQRDHTRAINMQINTATNK